MTQAKGEQLASPHSLAEMKEMQHSGTGSTGQEPAQSSAPSLLGWECATLCLDRFHGHCWALQHMLGSSSSHLACWGCQSLPLGHCSLLLGAEHRESLSATGQYPGVASSSFSTWVPTAWPQGAQERQCSPQSSFPTSSTSSQHPGGCGAGTHQCANRQCHHTGSQTRVQLQTGQAQALSKHCSFRNPSHPIPTHPRAQSVTGGNQAVNLARPH